MRAACDPAEHLAQGLIDERRLNGALTQQAWVGDDDHAAIRLLPISRLHWKIGRGQDVVAGARLPA